MIISLIAAIGKNNELGKGNDLLWKLPADIKYFKEKTSGHTVIMGRKTFESIGRPLPNRQNIVITRDTNYIPTGVEIVHSLNEALKIASLEQGKKFEENQEEVEIFIIGGAQIYAEAMEKANKLYITHIEAEDKDADAFFPEIIPIVFGEISRETHTPDEKNPLPYAFVEYKKF